MAINVIVQYNGVFLSDILLLNQAPIFVYGSMALLSYIITTLHCLLLCYAWWLCMAINISVQYNGGLLLDIILLTQGWEPV